MSELFMVVLVLCTGLYTLYAINLYAISTEERYWEYDMESLFARMLLSFTISCVCIYPYMP